jgi:D-alanyl-lipoteichoic acid acyltransferase DltB (MBOAT superfamily)
VVVLQLVLLVGIFRLFDIENPALYNRIGPLVLAGFVIHHFLPHRLRLPFFALLSIASVFLVFAWPLPGSGFQSINWPGLKACAWLLFLSGVLIAACHLPLSHTARCWIVVALAATFAVFRAGWIPSTRAIPIPPGIWPVLGSMFMFRLVSYLYDLRHGEVPVSPSHAIAYFFMLPNVLYTLFPLVDYKTFYRSHFNDDPFRIYQVGLQWILRGVLHLLLYRWLYIECVIDPTTATTALQAGQYILVTFMLYLRLSGTFHLVTGILRLFGFNLPETHFLYFLSWSFGELWRRMNVYWKDWMQKIIFYPMFYRLKGLGKWAIPVCTLLTFVVTWLLHSYQWFWIRGTFPIEAKDFVFWMGLAVFVLANSQWDQRAGKRRQIGPPKRTFGSEALHGLCAVGTFGTMCVLWTLWFTPNTEELKTLARALGTMTLREAAIFLAVALVVAVAAVLTRGWPREHVEGARSIDKGGRFRFWRYAGEVAVVGGVIAFAGFLPSFLDSFPGTRRLISRLKHQKLNRQDVARLERGYYEDLGDVTRFNSDLWVAFGGQPPGWSENKAVRQRDDVLSMDLQPSANIEFKGVRFITNSLGMRDREYGVKKSPGTYRIVIVGASHDVGVGVENNETYENLCEDRLNRDRVGQKIEKYEILNLSCGGYGPLQKMLAVEMKGLACEPDLVIYVANKFELHWAANQFDRVAKLPGTDLAQYFAPALDAAGVKPGDTIETVEAKTASHRESLLRLIFERLMRNARAARSDALVALLEVPSDLTRTGDMDRVITLARESGLPVLDMWGAFRGVSSRESLWIAADDQHTNARGHALLAERLYELLAAPGVLPDPGPEKK